MSTETGERDTAPGPQAGSRDGTASEGPRPDPWIGYAELAATARAQPRSLRRLRMLLAECVRLVWSTDRRAFISTSALQLVGGIIAAAQVLVTKIVLEQILHAERTGGSAGRALPAILVLGAVTAFSSISAAFVAQQLRRLSELTARATWNRILDVAGRVDLLAYEGSAFYDQLRRVQINAVTRPYSVVQGMINLSGGVIGSIGVATAILAIAPMLLPILLLGGVPLWYASRKASGAEFTFTVRQNETVRKRTYLGGVLTGRDEAKELRAFGLTAAIRDRFDWHYDSYLADLRHHLRRKSRIIVLGQSGSAALLVATLILLVWLVNRHELNLAEAGAALIAIRMLSSQVTSLFGGLQMLFESGLFVEDLRRFLAVQSGPAESEQQSSAPRGFERLRADHISFTYPGSSKPALRRVNLDIHAGQVVAVVGENGSGKTTLAKVLAGLFDPDEGTITWDSRDISKVDKADLRRSIAVIFQDFVRYQLTAAENIGAGRPEAIDDLDAIAAAAKQAGAHSFLASLPDGYATLLGKQFKGGQDLSGGQWQRVALARAFYRDAPFVILDEPTASLDPRAEADLFQSIRELLTGRTVLLISHRFSSVRYADLIYVMKHGEVVEVGSHDELVARAGLYAELFTLQAAAYTDPSPSPSRRG